MSIERTKRGKVPGLFSGNIAVHRFNSVTMTSATITRPTTITLSIHVSNPRNETSKISRVFTAKFPDGSERELRRETVGHPAVFAPHEYAPGNLVVLDQDSPLFNHDWSVERITMRPMYKVTRRFTGGLLNGLEHTDTTSVKFDVGFVCDKPVFNGSPYIITAVELVTSTAI